MAEEKKRQAKSWEEKERERQREGDTEKNESCCLGDYSPSKQSQSN